MKYIKTFENSKLKKGDYVYPKPEHCWSKFNVLRPIKYQIQDIIRSDGINYLVLDNIDVKYNNEFPEDWFLTEFEYDQIKYNV